jgi:hypothetical protein
MQSQTDSSPTEDGGKPKVRNRFKRLAILGLAGATALFSVNEMYYVQYSQKNKYLKAECDNYNGENMPGLQQKVKIENITKATDYNTFINNLNSIIDRKIDTGDIKDVDTARYLKRELERNEKNLFEKPIRSFDISKEGISSEKLFNFIIRVKGEDPQKYESKPSFSLQDGFGMTLWQSEEGFGKIVVFRVVGNQLNLGEVAAKLETIKILEDTAFNLNKFLGYDRSTGAQSFNSEEDARSAWEILARHLNISKKPTEIYEVRTERGPLYITQIGKGIFFSSVRQDLLNSYLTESGFYKGLTSVEELLKPGQVTVMLTTKNQTVINYVIEALRTNGFEDVTPANDVVHDNWSVQFDSTKVAEKAKREAEKQIDIYVYMNNLKNSIEKSGSEDGLKKSLKKSLKESIMTFDSLITESQQRTSEKLYNEMVSKQRGILAKEKKLPKEIWGYTLRELGHKIEKEAEKVGVRDENKIGGREDAKSLIKSFKLAYFEKNVKSLEEFEKLYTKIEKRKSSSEYTSYISALGNEKNALIGSDKEIQKEIKSGRIKSQQLSDLKNALKKPASQKKDESYYTEIFTERYGKFKEQSTRVSPRI